MKKLQITIGVIRSENSETFITHRVTDAHMANKLELPGSKVGIGGTPERAAVHEPQGEIGITP